MRASRAGRVVVAASRLSGWGGTVVVEHADGHLTVYAGLDQLLSAPGTWIPQGMPLGRLGNSSLLFQIRQGTSARDTLALLPR